MGIGRFSSSKPVVLAPFTTIRGAGADRTSLTYTSTGPVSAQGLISGATFRADNFSFYVLGEFTHAFLAGTGSRDVDIVNVRFRANPYMKNYAGPASSAGQHMKTKVHICRFFGGVAHCNLECRVDADGPLLGGRVRLLRAKHGTFNGRLHKRRHCQQHVRSL